MDNLRMDTPLDFDIPDELVSSGLHTAVIDEISVAQGEKAPYLSVRFVLQDEDCAGLMLFFNITLSDNPRARRITKKNLEGALGRELKPTGETLRGLLSEMKGRPCIVDVYQDTYEGDTRAKIKRLLPIGGSEIGEEGTEKSAIDELFG